MTKQALICKLTSRKLWVAVVGIIVGLAAAFGLEENEYAQIAGVVGSIASGMAYIIGEAKVDSESTKTDTFRQTLTAVASGMNNYGIGAAPGNSESVVKSADED